MYDIFDHWFSEKLLRNSIRQRRFVKGINLKKFCLSGQTTPPFRVQELYLSHEAHDVT